MTGDVQSLSKKLLLRRYTASYGASIATGSTKRMLPSSVGYTIPTGYVPLGIAFFSTGNSNLSLDYLHLYANSDQSSSYLIAVKNTGTAATGSTNKATFDVLFAPEGICQTISYDDSGQDASQGRTDIIGEPIFKRITFTGTYSSLASGSGKAFSQTDMGFYVPDGYKLFSLWTIASGSQHVSVSDCNPLHETRMLTIRNTHSSAQSGTATLRVSFINEKYSEQIVEQIIASE